MITEVNNIIFSVIGLITILFLLIKGIMWLIKRIPKIKFNNPLKSYIRKEVMNYLKELQK